MSRVVESRPFEAGVLERYAGVPIRFTVRSILRVEMVDRGLGGLRLVETPAEPPYEKDYDDYERPQSWQDQFDMAHWRFFFALDGGEVVGALALVWDTPAIFMLEGRQDLALVWDLRIAPEARGQGVGRALWRAAEAYARSLGMRQMKVETQNINAPACRFYHAMGCSLGGLRQNAYHEPGCEGEAMMLWYLDV